MTVRSLKLIAIVLVIVGVTTMILPGNYATADDEYNLTSAGLGSAETLMSRYQQWESESLKKSGEGNLILPLAPSNTLWIFAAAW